MFDYEIQQKLLEQDGEEGQRIKKKMPKPTKIRYMKEAIGDNEEHVCRKRHPGRRKPW